MTKATLWKIIIALLLIGAAALGLARRAYTPGTDDLKRAETDSSSLEDYFKAAQQAAPINQTTEVSFLAVGDIMLSRNVAGTIAKAKDPLLPFRTMESILKSTDFNFANLESPLSGSNAFNPTGSLVFNAPPAYVQGLKDYNFSIVNLANNHALDQGKAGIVYTRNYLDGLGIKYVGAGANLGEAWQPAIMETKGLKIGFVGASYASANDGGKATNEYVARIQDTTRLKQVIEALRPHVDFIVVTMHAGTEYTRIPNQGQVDFAHAAIDDGADIVIGAHPHWVQTVEQYGGKYIFYSLGNFIFDQEWSQDTKEGLTLKITLTSSKAGNPTTPGAASMDDLQGTRQGAKIKHIELIPVIIENYSTPRPATEAESAKILQKINQQSTIVYP